MINMKKCSKCKQDKELNQFCKKKDTLDGYHIYCKLCRNLISKNEYQNHIEYKKKYYQINREYKLKYQNKYKLNHIEKIKNYNVKYQIINKDKIQYNTLIYKRKKYKDDPNFKLGIILRIRLYHALKSQNSIKSNKTLNLLGCTIPEFKQYLEQQFKPEMTWANHGQIWEIDHIKSCASFDLTNIKQQKECFHYSNIQPLFKNTKIAESFGYISYIGNREKRDK